MAETALKIALTVLVLSFAATFLALVAGWPDFDDAFRLTSELLSWEPIAGGLVIGGASTFGAEIRAALGGPVDAPRRSGTGRGTEGPDA